MPNIVNSNRFTLTHVVKFQDTKGKRSYNLPEKKETHSTKGEFKKNGTVRLNRSSKRQKRPWSNAFKLLRKNYF